jgi:signal transduction histidine kinase/CheY-like chemotaxis protein
MMQRFFVVFIISLLSFSLYAYDNIKSRDELISAYIYLLSKNTSWPNEESFKTFKITIVDDDLELYHTFKRVSKDLSLKNRNIELFHVDSIDDINYNDTSVIFLSKNFRDSLKDVYHDIDLNFILLISEAAKDSKHIMINLYEDKKYRINIEVNLNNIQVHSLDVNNKILLAGGSKVGIAKLYHSSIDMIKKQEKQFMIYQNLNNKLKKDLQKYKFEIDTLNKKIYDKKMEYEKTISDIAKKELFIEKKDKLLKLKERKIELKEKKILRLKKDLNTLKNKLRVHKDILNKKIKNIEKQKQSIERYSKILDEKILDIEKLDKKIKEQEEMILLNQNMQKKQKHQIEQQQTSIYLMGIIAGLLFFFVLYFYKNKLRYQQLNENLQIAKDEAIYANKAKSTFIAKMSHELRTPLNAILGFSDLLLKNDDLTRSDKKAIKIINSSGVFLLTLINDILDISSIESKKILLEEKSVDLRRILDDVSLIVQNSVEAKNLALEVKYKDYSMECIVIDDKKIKQILLNIITNAIKYSDKGTISVVVSTEDNHLLDIKISDEGVGISEDELKYVFEPFKQVGEASSSTGTGLGLAIVKQFVNIMNGEIFVKSELDKGSVFEIKIPYKECNSDEINMDNLDQTKQIIGISKDSKRLKVLIVEDKENNILLLKNILSILHFELEIAKNGEDAISLFESFKPDLIFMDKRMPKMNGNVATNIIRGLKGGRDVKIIFLTANAFASKMVKEFDVDDFILKPYKPNEIYNVISKHFDVKYIYKSLKTKDIELSHEFSKSKFQESLKKLDKELLDELFDKALLLNQEDMFTILKKIKTKDENLYNTLEKLVSDINFIDIVSAIKDIRKFKK